MLSGLNVFEIIVISIMGLLAVYGGLRSGRFDKYLRKQQERSDTGLIHFELADSVKSVYLKLGSNFYNIKEGDIIKDLKNGSATYRVTGINENGLVKKNITFNDNQISLDKSRIENIFSEDIASYYIISSGEFSNSKPEDIKIQQLEQEIELLRKKLAKEREIVNELSKSEEVQIERKIQQQGNYERSRNILGGFRGENTVDRFRDNDGDFND